MKRFGIVLVIMLVFVGGAFAQTSFQQQATITPDSPIYFLDRGLEFFEGFMHQHSVEAKAEWQLSLAEERLGEAEVMVGKGVDVTQLMLEYENNVRIANEFEGQEEKVRLRVASHEAIASQVRAKNTQQLGVVNGQANSNGSDSVSSEPSFLGNDLRPLAQFWVDTMDLDTQCVSFGGTFVFEHDEVACNGFSVGDCGSVDKQLAKQQCVSAGATWTCGIEGLGCYNT